MNVDSPVVRFAAALDTSATSPCGTRLTITGGDVRNAQRRDSPNNTLWRITVEPSVTGRIRIRLPATKICDAKGATCAADDRKLSTELDFTVPRQYPLGSKPPIPSNRCRGQWI